MRRGPWGRRSVEPGRTRRGSAAWRQGREPDEPAVEGGGEPLLPASRVRRPRDEHVPLHVLIATRPGRTPARGLRRPGGPASRGPRAPGRSAASTSSPSNGASASTARRRTAGLSPVAARIAGRPRSSPIAPRAATAASRTRASSADPASAINRSRTGARFDSCSPHDHAATSTTAGSSSCRAPTRSTAG